MTTPPDETVVLTVRGRQFFAILKELREATGMTQEQAGAAIGMSRQQYQRFEGGTMKKIKTADVEVVLDLFGCREDVKLGMVDLAPQLHKRNLWTTYGDVVNNGFAEIESNAKDIRTCQYLLVPGVLQTPETTAAIARLSLGEGADEETLYRRVAGRAERRKKIMAAQDKTFHAIIWEPVLHSPIGGEEVHREQLRSLIHVATKTNVMLQVLPISSWEHPGHNGSFSIYGFGGPTALDVVYFEGVAGSSLYLEKPHQVERCSVTFDRISQAALPGKESTELIEGLLS